MNAQTAVIDMRTPATAPLPVLGQPVAHARRPRRSLGDALLIVERGALATGWGTLLVLLVRWCLAVPVV